jgi:hypothetical protein
MIGMPGLFELLIIAVLVIPAVVAAVALFVVSRSKRNQPYHDPGNLVPCPDCQGGVSMRAQTCPHCGAPLKPSA